MAGGAATARASVHPQGFEYWGRISALKARIVFADKVSTVSPTYAEELTPEFGMGMEGVLASRGGDFVGIWSGIDSRHGHSHSPIWRARPRPALRCPNSAYPRRPARFASWSCLSGKGWTS